VDLDETQSSQLRAEPDKINGLGHDDECKMEGLLDVVVTSAGRSSVVRPKCTRLAVDEGDVASRVPFGVCWDAFHKEESPRTGIPIHDFGPRGLGIRI
jgi:hypothetical protein